MRRIIAYLATSVDGFIARPNGDVDWLDRPRPPGNYGMGAFMRSVDTKVMGRATYDVGKKLGPPPRTSGKNIILSRTLAPNSVEGYTVEKGDVRSFANRWRKESGKIRIVWFDFNTRRRSCRGSHSLFGVSSRTPIHVCGIGLFGRSWSQTIPLIHQRAPSQ